MTSQPVSWIADDNCYMFQCPHCDVPIQVEANQVNCRIFRHGQMKNTYMVRFGNRKIAHNLPLDHLENQRSYNLKSGDNVRAKQSLDAEYENAVILRVNQGQQVPPHASQKVCDELAAKGLIWGCGKPFILVRGSSGRVEKVETCEYI